MTNKQKQILENTISKIVKNVLTEVETEKISNGLLREPIYTIGDNIEELILINKKLKDAKLTSLINKIEDSLTNLKKYLNKNYNWD
jgi:hypothetical protein